MQEDQIQSIIRNCDRIAWDILCSRRGFDQIPCNPNPILEFLAETFHQGLDYNTVCCHSSVTAYHGSIFPFFVEKQSHISVLITGLFNNRMPQPKQCFIWDVGKVLSFLNSLDSERIEFKMLTYKVVILLTLTGLFTAHEICYLDIHYLMKHSSGYTLHVNKLTKTTREGILKRPIKYLYFNFKKTSCVCYHID